jgi:DNA polymerase-3 subunit delta'
MAFDELLGNSQLKDNLKRGIQSGHISHFYLICGPEGSGRHTLARLLAAAILCRDSEKPCLRCNPCRKVLENNHPDFITVEDPEHKAVPVKLVRQYREDMFIRPNEADHKIYLFPQELGIEGQNALLKILEEPPSYGVFILLTDNPERLLPTVRSRCTELTLRPLDDKTLKSALARQFPNAQPEDLSAAAARSGGFLGQAIRLMTDGTAATAQTEAFATAFGEKSALLLTTTLVPMEKWKRDALITELENWVQLLENALAYRSGMNAVSPAARDIGTRRSSADLMNAIAAVQKGIEYAQINVSTGAICGWLSWALR